MADLSQTQEMQKNDQVQSTAEERSRRVTTAAWLAGGSAFLGFMTLDNQATMGAGLAFVGIAGMVAVVCHFILRSR